MPSGHTQDELLHNLPQHRGQAEHPQKKDFEQPSAEENFSLEIQNKAAVPVGLLGWYHQCSMFWLCCTRLGCA